MTATSMLIQCALLRRDKNQKVIEAVVDVLLEVEGLIKNQHRIQTGLNLLGTARETLSKLVLKPKSSNPGSPAQPPAPVMALPRGTPIPGLTSPTGARSPWSAAAHAP